MRDFTLMESRTQEEMHPAPYHQLLFPDGATWAEFFRTESGYLLRFPELADFEISGNDLTVTCRPAPDVAYDTCEHLFLNQMIPLVLSKRGKLVFHASGVEVAGVAAAFFGETGRGKSTLAASFATSGHRFLTDDGLVVEACDGGFQILPSHPSIRLWEDSQRALVAAGAMVALPLPYSAKVRFLAGKAVAFCKQSRPLKRAYFLGDGQAPGVTFQRMRAPEAMMEWVRNSFLLDPMESSLLASHFKGVAVLANRIGCYRLDYPRRFEDLPRVRHAIIEHLQEEDVAA